MRPFFNFKCTNLTCRQPILCSAGKRGFLEQFNPRKIASGSAPLIKAVEKDIKKKISGKVYD